LDISYRFCYAEYESDEIGLLRQDFEKIKTKYVKKGDFNYRYAIIVKEFFYYNNAILKCYLLY